jgi:hypothetical protein
MTSANEPIGTDPLDDSARPTSTGAENLDEDALGTDPLEEGMDPPEHWSSVTESGHDDIEPESLDERLAEEEPDLDPNAERTVPERPEEF